MVINDWWTTDPDERFWMEITDREDLGADLLAPTTNGSGRPYWGYELLTYVQAGDVVLHWHKTLHGEPGIVGWSEPTGAYEDTDISWQAHGSVGRATGSLGPRPAWRMPLRNFTTLADPILLSEVRALEDDLRQTHAQLEADHPAGPLYFPFSFSNKRELRAQQTYFVKMPRRALELLGLERLEETVGLSPLSNKSSTAARQSGSGYIADSAVRSAVEWRAVNMAIEAYIARGYEVAYTGSSKPYDLEATTDSETRHVEVKGSAGAATAIELTTGEVGHSRQSVPTDLYVVDGIRWERQADGSVHVYGGAVRLWEDWAADDDRLAATRFRYQLPPGGSPGS